MKKNIPLIRLILVLVCLLLPAVAFAADNPAISSLSPASLARNYSNQVDIKVTGTNTTFQMGQSTVAILNAGGQVVDNSGPVKEVIDGTNLVFTLSSGLPTGTYQVRVTTGNEVAFGGTLTVRGVPSISLSSAQLAVGYQTTEIGVYGVNTGFSDKTTVTVVNHAGVSQGVGGTPRVINGSLLTFNIAPGLAEGDYRVIVQTEHEEAETSFSVAKPTVVLKFNGNSFTGMPAGYFNDYDLTVKGTNTGFTGTTAVKLLEGSLNGPDKSQFLSGISVTNKENISLTVKKGLPPGQYFLTLTTDEQELAASFTVFSPQISGMNLISDLANGTILPEGYQKIKVEVYGLNTAFNLNSSVKINGQTGNISGLVIHSTSKLSFDLLPGLAAGSYQILVDLDGNSGTTEDQINGIITISQPVIAKLNGKVILGSAEPASIIVTGVNTHFSEGSPRVMVEGVPAVQIISVSVVDDTNMVFRILPSSMTAPGTYNITVETIGVDISESARGNGVLIVENSGITISPSVVYSDELGSKVVTVKGTGTSFTSGTEVTIDSVKVTTSVKSTTEVTFVTPANLSAGLRQVTVKSGDKTYQTSLEAAERTISLSVTSKTFGYEPFSLVVTGNGVTFDSSANKPSVTVSGYGAVTINSADISANKFAFQMPAGLQVGSHQVTVSFQQGSYSQIGSLEADFVVNALDSLVFKMNQVVFNELKVIEGEPDFYFTVEGQLSTGIFVNYSIEAGLSVISGSDVISLTKENNSVRINIKKAGNARIMASYGGKQSSVDIEVLAKTPAPGGIPVNTGGSSPTGNTEAPVTSKNNGTPTNTNSGTSVNSNNNVTPVNSNNSQGSAAPGIFKDTLNHWAKGNIELLVASGAVKGYSDGSFKPDARITRAEFATILANALGLGFEGSYQLNFKDNSSIPAWAKPTLAAVVKRGIVGGYADGTFGANNQITRAEIAAMVAKALQLKAQQGTSLSFSDNASIPSWAKDSVLAAVQNGIIGGYGDKTFRANNKATRAEAVTMIVNMLEYINSAK